jgi:DNA-binding transcriptional regulator YiaG
MRVVENYEDFSLGFLVIFERAIFKPHGDDLYLDVNNRQYQDTVFDMLWEQPIQLSGAQLTYIRDYMDLTQKELANLLGLESHSVVSQWEKAKQEPADIRPAYLQALKVQMAKFRNREALSVRFLADVLTGKLEAKQIVLPAAA